MMSTTTNKVTNILGEALRGYDLSERYRSADGYVRWGLVERDIHAEIEKLEEQLAKDQQLLARFGRAYQALDTADSLPDELGVAVVDEHVEAYEAIKQRSIELAEEVNDE